MKKQYIHPVIEVQASICNSIICASGSGALEIHINNPSGGDVTNAF